MTLKELQAHVALAWTNESYTKEFNGSGIAHKDFGHALLHIVKASGKLAAMVEDADHGRRIEDDPGKYLADLVICAARTAHTLGLHLESVVDLRLAAKLPLPASHKTSSP